jgi:hypothetical protein
MRIVEAPGTAPGDCPDRFRIISNRPSARRTNLMPIAAAVTIKTMRSVVWAKATLKSTNCGRKVCRESSHILISS